MHVLISVDMEGVSGVVLRDHILQENSEYQRFRALMTAEANAAVEGALAGGAETVVVTDSHGRKSNILIEQLTLQAELISGSPRAFGMMQGIHADVHAVFFVGYHAASGSGTATLSHTHSRRLLDVWLNGKPVGEMGLNAALAGYYSAPVVLVTGDEAVCREARTLLGDIETVVVKKAVSWSAARCLHPEVARERIRDAAERALTRDVSPFVIPPPITLRIVFARPVHTDMAALVPGTRRTDGRTIEWTGESMPAVYKAFLAMSTLAAAGE